ncbi:hypothetical protein [Amycolatopsis tolypomycina]|nr:hypothetical protein [Amycolatopsis tolypomycina]
MKSIYAEVGAFGGLERHVMDTTVQSLDETADAVRRHARSAAFAL